MSERLPRCDEHDTQLVELSGGYYCEECNDMKVFTLDTDETITDREFRL